MTKKFIASILLILTVISFSVAGDINKAGTASASQLLIPVGARSISMGSGAIASVTGAEAIYWNPAGLVNSEKSEIMFNSMKHIADIDMSYVSAVFNGGDMGAFGFHIKSLDFGNIEETTTAQPDGTGKTYSPTFVVGGLTYSRSLTDKITAGVTGKYVFEEIMQTSASTFAFDMGIQYSFATNMRLGVTLKNIGGKMQYDGRNLEQQQVINGTSLTSDQGYFRGVALESDIPTTFSFGFAYKHELAENSAINLTSAFTQQNDASDQYFGGVEYGYDNMLFLRAGYTTDVQGSDENLYGMTFGAGINLSVADFNVHVDYAYRDVTDYFDASNVFTIKLGL